MPIYRRLGVMTLTQELVIAATGDSMISRRISSYKKCEPVRNLIKGADVGFTNCEMLFHNCESYPMVTGIGTAMYAEPFMAEELAWIGFDMATLSNSHSLDYGPIGMFSTVNALQESGLICAGVGRDLDEAREPKYLETEKGRVALVASCYDTFHQSWERASNAKAGVLARPGMNLLRVNAQIDVTREMFSTLKKINSEAGLCPPSGKKEKHREHELTFLGQKFKCGNRPGIHRTIEKEDLEEVLLSVKDARRSADWVIASLHSHTSNAKGLEYPADFICKYARACIDAGADAFLGHGPHILRGIEIYKKKPILYSLGNFIVHNLTVKKVTYDQYKWFGLGEKARPSDYYERRFGQIPPSEPPYSQWWFESVVALLKFRGNLMTELKVYPITLGFGEKHRARVGYPELADEKQAKRIVQHLEKISFQWNTKINYAHRTGIVL